MYTAGDVKKIVYLGQGNVKIKWHILVLLQYTEITVYGKSLDFFPLLPHNYLITEAALE